MDLPLADRKRLRLNEMDAFVGDGHGRQYADDRGKNQRCNQRNESEERSARHGCNDAVAISIRAGFGIRPYIINFFSVSGFLTTPFCRADGAP